MFKQPGQSLQFLFDNHVVGMMEVDARGRYLLVNEQWGKMIGYSVKELLAADFQSVTHPDDLPEQLLLDKELETGKSNSYRLEKRYIRKNGEIFWGDLSVTGLYNQDGTLTGMVGLVIDITERKAAEESLKESEKKFRSLLDRLEHIPIRGYNEERKAIYWNAASTEVYGYSRDEVLGKKLEELIIPADLCDEIIKLTQFWMTEGSAPPAGEITLCDKEGHDVPVYSSHIIHTTASGAKELFCVDIDLRMLHKAENQLRGLAAAVEQTGETIVITDTNGIIEYVNPAFTAVTGYTRDEAVGQNPRFLKGDELDDSIYTELWTTITHGRTWKGRFYNKRKDGSRFVEDVNISPIVNSTGKIVNYVAAKRDITEQLMIEGQYRQAQKMEAVGQLAGGVAHDFNNMLAIILGQVEIALLKIPPGDPLEKRLQEIKNAANRSAELTQQLLGYARKQSRQSQVLDLNDTVATMLNMLKRLIGENLELRWQPGAALSLVNMDSSHLNQILTNLIINARDAVAGSGIISVQTTQVVLDEKFCQEHPGSSAGDYVLLQISDNGCGMSRDLLPRIFDPFFTTKAVNKGTGLGLSMVFGLVKQNNGFIAASSSPGQGSTFSLYFPRTQMKEKLSIQANHGTLLHGSETILVVEDEAALLDVTVAMLTESGYAVLSAQGPVAAIQLAEDYAGTIHLLLTDVVMPEMNGIELSSALLKTRPELKVLYMSGYPRDHLVRQQDYKHGSQLLKKPFSAHTLTRTIRGILAR